MKADNQGKTNETLPATDHSISNKNTIHPNPKLQDESRESMQDRL
jgi:hypothetical protein